MKSYFLVLELLIATLTHAQPYEPSVIWDRSGETDSSAYGYQILPLGDQNDDGFADWAVQSFGNIATWHGTHRPYLEFIHGGLTPADSLPYFVFQQDSPTYYQSWYVGVVGDINGDGYKDWMTEYWPQDLPPYRIEAIFYGGHAPSNTPDFEWPVPLTNGFYWIDNFDFNGDDFGDLYFVDGQNNRIVIYYGSTSLDTIPDVILHPPQSHPSAVGDFNGDGASDFMCSNPNNGNLAIFLGGAQPDTVPAYFWPNVFGPLGGVKSLNGDAADEFLLDLGVYLGRDSLHSTPDYVLNSEAGDQAVSAGDFNHDSYNDLILLTPTTPNNMFGALDLHLGHPWLNADPVFTIEGWTPPLNLIGIYSAAGPGDVNGDGIDDIAIGAWDDFAYLGWRGRCIIIAGDDSLIVSADGPRPELPDALKIEVYPNPFNSEATIKLAAPLSKEPFTLTIINVLGQEVRREVLPRFSGIYTYRFNAQDLASGLYLVHAQSGEVQTTQKLMLLR